MPIKIRIAIAVRDGAIYEIRSNLPEQDIDIKVVDFDLMDDLASEHDGVEDGAVIESSSPSLAEKRWNEIQMDLQCELNF
jgi:hypothetical protein